MDVDLIKRLQMRATKLVQGIGKKNYEDSLRLLQTITLQKRQLSLDVIDVLEFLNGFECIDRSKFLGSADSN